MSDINLGITTDIEKYMKMCTSIKLACTDKVRRGICNPKKCASCQTMRNLNSFMNNLSPLEQEYVNARTHSQVAAADIMIPARSSPIKHFCGLLKIIFIIIAVFSALPIIMGLLWKR